MIIPYKDRYALIKESKSNSCVYWNFAVMRMVDKDATEVKQYSHNDLSDKLYLKVKVFEGPFQWKEAVEYIQKVYDKRVRAGYKENND